MLFTVFRQKMQRFHVYITFENLTSRKLMTSLALNNRAQVECFKVAEQCGHMMSKQRRN